MKTPSILITERGVEEDINMEKQTKIFVVTAKTEFELVKKLNEENKQKKVFATQPMQKLDKSWVAFIYYN
ncbi:MAG: hypothetical protein ABII03_00785 [Nanoarchaeota archaeon]